MSKNMKLIIMAIASLLLIGIVMVVLIQIKKAGEISESSLIKPKAMTFDHSLDKNVLNKMIWGARLYYTFWDTGDYKYLEAALSPTFVDHTLSSGNTQGLQGQKDISRQMRFAIPDLHCTIEDLLIVGEMVTARLNFQGTSKFPYSGHPATNKPVEFTAIDILHFQDGKIVDEWHVEDRLSLFQQLNIISENKTN